MRMDEPARGAPDVGQVGNPAQVGGAGGEVTVYEVRRPQGSLLRVVCDFVWDPTAPSMPIRATDRGDAELLAVVVE